MQSTAAQCPQTQSVTDLQLARRITKRAGLTTIEMEFEKALFAGQAGQGIRPRHAIDAPQHQVLARLIAQHPLGLQT
ncbi:hypothetical protein D3C77_604190 [compost metagenome]